MDITRGMRRIVMSVGMLCCLTAGVLPSHAAAKSIIVTTLTDTTDPPFNTGGLCGSGTVADLPGADGQVSLREAIHAANHTPGKKSISFASTLSGATIVLTGPLYLCGGHTTLNGDVNGDHTPDVTIDGNAVTPPFDVIGIVSSHNTVKSLRVLALAQNPLVSGLSVTATPAVATTVMHNTLAHNIIHGVLYVGTGADEFNNRQSISDVTVKHVRVHDNEVSGSLAFGILVGNNGNRNVLTDLTITGNTVFGNREGISVRHGWQNFFHPEDGGANDNRLDVTITDNDITGNGFPSPNPFGGIIIFGGVNFLPPLPPGVSTNNHLTALVRGNRVENNVGPGILTYGGLGGATDNQVDVTIKDNSITGNQNPGNTAGIAVLGGFVASSNQVAAELLNNTIVANTGNGITVASGLDNSSDNDVAVTIRDNTLENNTGVGIVTYGGFGALFFPSGDSSNNILDARIERNTIKNAPRFGLLVFGGLGSFDGAPTKVANNNAVTAVVKDNTITGTVGEGMLLSAGGPGVANTNSIEIAMKKNTVCNSAVLDIHAIGGFLGGLLPPNQGAGNSVAGKIAKNTATTIVVEDGVPGNVANVTQSKNDPCQ
ncbi:MAG: right-handed parallel beta-helix repeat-containing protein [Candidatus Binatia bacterium]